MMDLKFQDFIQYVSRIDKLSICHLEDLHYENYRYAADIPEGKYDDYYVFGVGIIESEFPFDENHLSPEELAHRVFKNYALLPGLEIMISKVPRDVYYDGSDNLPPTKEGAQQEEGGLRL